MVVPRTVESFDADCQRLSKRMELQPVQLAQFNNCGQDCAALLVAAGAVAAASVVVSGSIAIVGNVAYWMEEGRCAPLQMPKFSTRKPT